MDYESYLKRLDANIPDLLSVYKNESSRVSENTIPLIKKLDEEDEDDRIEEGDIVNENIKLWTKRDYALLKGSDPNAVDPNNYRPPEEGNYLTAEAAYERYILGIQKFQTDPRLIDVTSQVYWRATSSKPGCSIEKVADSNPATYWQSDGFLPHIIEANFPKNMSLSVIALFFSIAIDESYSPYLIKIYAGNGPMDIMPIKSLETVNINGWTTIGDEATEPIACKYIKIIIYSNHQNGKDTHLRGIKFLSSKKADATMRSYDKDQKVSTRDSNDLSETRSQFETAFDLDFAIR